MSSLQNYLAKNYLSKKEQKKLKKEKKLKSISSNTIHTEKEPDDLKDAVIVMNSTETRDEPVITAKQTDALEDPISIFKPLSSSKSTKYSTNRFQIRLGPKWDNVNRSNGYESKWMAKQKSQLYATNNKDYYDDDLNDHYSD